ncbi:unnamed protein product [Chrysoparadoxa australica]
MGDDLPPCYSFPPFFTLQPVLSTREKQLKLWCDLVLTWHKKHSTAAFQWQQWELWANKTIGRKLSVEGAEAVCEALIASGHAEWEDAAHTRLTLFWESPATIASSLYAFAKERSMIGGVFTVFELVQGDDSIGTKFHGMDEAVLVKGIQVLEREQKAEMFSSGQQGSALDGIKFL